MENRFYRSLTDRRIAGVCGGLAEYFGIDPTLVRVLFVLSFFLGTIGVWGYVLLWLLAPERY